jgi:hypothetical protein
MPQPPTPPEPPTQPLPQPQSQQGMPPGGPQPPYGPVPAQQPPKKAKRFGWPTLIITAVVALGLGGIVGGAGDATPTAEPAATATVTETQQASEPSQEPEPTTKPEPKKTTKPAPKPEPAQRVTKREWAKVVKNPDNYIGERYIIYGQVTQFDSATGDDNFLADTAPSQHHGLRLLRWREHPADR